jgi:hypothetical protein
LHDIYFNGKANNSPPPVNYKRLNQQKTLWHNYI